MTKPNIFMIVENQYPKDTRVRKEVNTLKQAYSITLVALKSKEQSYIEHINDITIYRVPEIKSFPSQTSTYLKNFLTKLNYLLQYFYFTSVALLIFLLTLVKKKYKIVHVHNPPDTLAIFAILCKIFSIKFIFDHHDLSPELYLTRFGRNKDLFYRVLILLEKLSCRLSDVIITTNDSYKQLVTKRHTVDINKIYIVRNDPILSDFIYKNPKGIHTNSSERYKILYVGSVNPQDGLELLVHSINYLINKLGRLDIVCYIVGDGDSFLDICQLVKQFNLDDFFVFTGYITEHNLLKKYFIQSDICVEPAPFNYLNRHSTFIKVMEYMAAAKPIVAFDLQETRHSTNGGAILVRPNDTQEFAKGINSLLLDASLRQKLAKKGYERIVKQLNWNASSSSLITAYHSLLA